MNLCKKGRERERQKEIRGREENPFFLTNVTYIHKCREQQRQRAERMEEERETKKKRQSEREKEIHRVTYWLCPSGSCVVLWSPGRLCAARQGKVTPSRITQGTCQTAHRIITRFLLLSSLCPLLSLPFSATMANRLPPLFTRFNYCGGLYRFVSFLLPEHLRRHGDRKSVV